MSWSASAKVSRHESLHIDVSGNEQALKERDEQVNAAKDATIGLIQSDVFLGGQVFSVALSGHANPGHKPVAGYANDTVTVTVTQIE